MARRKPRVVWTESATGDLVEIVSFVALNSPVHARRLLLKLRSKAESLERSPQRDRVVPELASAGTRAWRELVVKPHRIVYRIRKDVVLVGAVLDGRRDLEDLLLERLTRNVWRRYKVSSEAVFGAVARRRVAPRNCEVESHLFVVGELGCGTLKRRDEILSILRSLPRVVEADHDEVIALVDAERLSGTTLWTLDKRLAGQAKKLAVLFESSAWRSLPGARLS